jgi:hypothetical protein
MGFNQTPPCPMLSSRVRLWRAMRHLRCFDMRQLMLATETRRSSAWLYVGALRRAGYLARHGTRLHMIRDTGPKPPRLLYIVLPCRTLVGVKDLNTGERYGLDGNPAPSPSRREGRRVPPDPKPRRLYHWRWHRKTPPKAPKPAARREASAAAAMLARLLGAIQ